ncbi:YopX family protein [Fusobacterium nucleatum]|uniref:YopX family protein n=1 Tax=Fusobacterium nucleatum TaxID=851 RepID=UPI0030D451AB
MREIKFRAWHKEKKEIVNVEEIDFMNKVINYIYNDYENNRQEIRGAYFENIELMQYTGLKDKNNKEIYEGDILFESFGEKYYKVVFENGSFRAEFEGDFEEHSFDLIDVVAQGCEIVGNIYENPELLGGQ